MYVGGEGKGGAAIKSKTATQTKDNDCNFHLGRHRARPQFMHVWIRIPHKIKNIGTV